MKGRALPVYAGYSGQYGRGIGNVLSGVARMAVPLIAPMVKRLGMTLFNAGMNKLERKLNVSPAQPSATLRPPPPPPPAARKVVKRKKPLKKTSVKARKRSRRDIFSK